MTTSKQCAHCKKTQPVEEFHRDSHAPQGRASWCKTCMTPRVVTLPRLLNTRARHRATAELLKLHAEEYEELLAKHRGLVLEENEILTAMAPVAAHTHGPVESTTKATGKTKAAVTDAPRLRPGARMEHEKVTDRVDVARCPHCIKSHDNGHICRWCGSTPDKRRAGTTVPVAVPKGTYVDGTHVDVDEIERRLLGQSPKQIAAILGFGHPAVLAARLHTLGRDDLARRFRGSA